MMTCAPVSLFGLSSTGFMSVCGARRAACACTACARPISPPSPVTALFSAMFCGLNGATFTSCRTSQRHKAATSVLLPASEVVPCTMIVLAFILKTFFVHEKHETKQFSTQVLQFISCIFVLFVDNRFFQVHRLSSPSESDKRAHCASSRGKPKRTLDGVSNRRVNMPCCASCSCTFAASAQHTH